MKLDCNWIYSDGIWFFICSEEIKDTKLGFWKNKGNACEIFSNSVITGSRTTLEFYEGQAPYGCKTDWVMHKYSILQREPCEGSKAKVFYGIRWHCDECPFLFIINQTFYSTASLVG